MAGTPEHSAWKEMKKRCRYKKHNQYHRYGGRGIRVCVEWEESFEAFFAYIGPKSSPEHSLDRFPNRDGNYEPGNVRWATDGEQSRNMCTNVWVEMNGKRQVLADWCNELGLNHARVRQRIHIGWNPIEALTAPKNARRKAA
jgi:hypothetical protein